ncbi:MAG: hypothetical protein ABIQ88_05535 [Chitinophagaceae bacterium]
MKPLLVLFAAALSTASCNKSNCENSKMLTGQWELRQSTGGFAGTINYQAGTGLTIEFDNNGQYRFIYPSNANGIPRSGAYTIKKSIVAGDWLLQLNWMYNGQSLVDNDSVRFDKNKLIFLPSASCCDIPTVTYERVE